MKLFCGGYTPNREGGIYTFELNDKNGKLKQLHLTKTTNPSYLCLSPNKEVLYTFEEIGQQDEPKLKAFTIDKKGRLSLINEQVIPGAYPCHLTLSPDRKFVLVACYGSGNVQCFSVKEDGSLGKMTDNVQHQGKSENKSRQEGPHAHMVAFDQDGKLYVCDLGIDKIMVYSLTSTGKLELLENEVIEIASGSGPRHMVFHPSYQYAFVLNELTSTISLLEKSNGKYAVKQDYLMIEEPFSGMPSGAAIRISKDGQLLFASDRTVNGISTFKVDAENGTLKLIETTSCGGIFPRDFNLSPDGEWLLSAHQKSNDIVVFSLEQSTGKLAQIGSINEIVSPTCLVFLED